jgi:hypothetical protein
LGLAFFGYDEYEPVGRTCPRKGADMFRTKLARWALVATLLSVGLGTGPVSAAGNRTPLRASISENACTFTVIARWHNLGFTPYDVRFDFYSNRTGNIIDSTVVFPAAGDRKATATFTRVPAVDSALFWGVVYIDQVPGDPSPTGAYTKFLAADCI